MSDGELKLIEEIADSNSQEGLKFWATCLVVECLSDWGVSTSVWFHGCSCSHHENEKAKNACKLKGRRAVELADGAWHHILNAFRDVKLSTGAISAISRLSVSGDKDFASSLLTSFQDCKSMMEFRSMQAWGFILGVFTIQHLENVQTHCLSRCWGVSIQGTCKATDA